MHIKYCVVTGHLLDLLLSDKSLGSMILFGQILHYQYCTNFDQTQTKSCRLTLWAHTDSTGWCGSTVHPDKGQLGGFTACWGRYLRSIPNSQIDRVFQYGTVRTLWGFPWQLCSGYILQLDDKWTALKLGEICLFSSFVSMLYAQNKKVFPKICIYDEGVNGEILL